MRAPCHCVCTSLHLTSIHPTCAAQIVTFVSGDMGRSQGEELVASFKRTALRSMTDVKTVVVVRGRKVLQHR